MFEAISIKTHVSTNPLDLGYLAESLLFYDKTNLYVNSDSLVTLLQTVGEDQIKELSDRGLLSIYTNAGGILGAADHSTDGLTKLSVDVYSAVNTDKHFDLIYDACMAAFQARGKARRTSQRLYQLLQLHKYEGQLVPSIRASLLDPEFTRSVIASVLNEMGIAKEFYGKEWSYDFLPLDEEYFTFGSNLDLSSLSRMAKQAGIPFDFSPSTLVLNIAEAMGDLQIAAINGSEIMTNPFYSKIIGEKLQSAFIKANVDKEIISQFQKYSLPKYSDLAGVINSGEKTFTDLLPLLDKAEKFRKWKTEMNEESDFIQEYFRAIQEESWLSTTPGKIGRFVVSNTASILAGIALVSAAGIAAGLAIGSFDSFILDRLGKKWKPNRFINGDFKKFLS